MKVFVTVAGAESMSAAAEALALSPSAVSKSISRLEERLGVRLLDRSTRSLRTTEEGARYAQRCEGILADVEEAEDSLSDQSGAVRGLVKINSSVPIAHYCLAPALRDVLGAYPELEVRLHVSDRVVDLYENDADLAIRVGPLADSSMQAKRLGTLRRLVVASPDYLREYGTPKNPSALSSHECIGFSFTSARLNRWSFASGDVVANGRLTADCGDTLRHLALAGAGIARLGSFMVRGDLEAGRLVEVLEGQLSEPPEPVHAVYPARERMPQRVRVLVDDLAKSLTKLLDSH